MKVKDFREISRQCSSKGNVGRWWQWINASREYC